MYPSLETNQTLPVSALPNFLRGVSQFKKSGILDFSTLSEQGAICFYEGRIVSLSLFEKSFMNMFLERLYNGGALPLNVYELLINQSHHISIDELIELLELHSIIQKDKFFDYYDSHIQEFIYKLLEAKVGEISFSMKTHTSFMVDYSDLQSSLITKSYDRAIYPCQLLLDYVESTLLVEELCFDGEYLSLIEEDPSAFNLLDSKEKRFVSFAKAGFSISQVLNAVCESRQAVFELLLELKKSGVLECIDTSPHASKSYYGDVNNEEDGGQETCLRNTFQESSNENVTCSAKGAIEKLNMFLVKPKGIEWVLRIFVPFGVLCMIFYFHIAIKMLLDNFSSMFSI
jgi:hypothetical protein